MRLESGRTLASETVLVVDDEDAVCGLICLELWDMGYQVLTAANASQTILEVQKQTNAVDLLLTDIFLPGSNGMELYGIMAARNPALRVLFMSAYPREQALMHGAGITELNFIQKPFSIETLAAKVRAVLDGPVSVLARTQQESNSWPLKTAGGKTPLPQTHE